jgi:hypothetical protein
MMTVTLTADLTILYFVAANIVGILAYVLILKHRMRTQTRRQAMLAAQIVDYFRHSGAEVRVNCILGPDGRRFIATIDSEPLKRFRYSHIVEASLINHVDKALGLHVHSVFWRFPLPAGDSSPRATADTKQAPREDEYIIQGLREAKTNPDYHVAEDSWDQFEKAQLSGAANPTFPVEDGKDDRGQ